MTPTDIGWKRMIFKDKKVWMQIDANGKPIVQNGKVRIKYRLDKDHEYWVHKKGVEAIHPSPSEPITSDVTSEMQNEIVVGSKKTSQKNGAHKDAIFIYTDGASSGNPGPSGIGAVLCFGKHKKEISKFIGMATNNIAELEAIKTSLMEIKNKTFPVRVFTDSRYAYGVLALGWKTKKNTALVGSIKRLLSTFRELKFVKVKGHAGVEGNEQANRLATMAVSKAAGQRKN